MILAASEEDHQIICLVPAASKEDHQNDVEGAHPPPTRWRHVSKDALKAIPHLILLAAPKGDHKNRGSEIGTKLTETIS